MNSAINKTNLGALSLYELSYGDCRVTVSAFGAQAISWKIADRDIYYSNPSLISDKSKPLRSGAPVCFPWFNKGLNWNLGREIAPSHGPSRSSEWTLVAEECQADFTAIAFSFETNSYLNLPLKIVVRYTVGNSSLKSEFEVSNLSSDTTNKFELALHSYFATPLPPQTKIYGLSGQQEPFNPNLPIDQIFENKTDNLKAEFSGYNLQINNSGFSKSVVWHPGLTHKLADLPQNQSPVPFLCLESLSEKIEIPVSEKWTGSVEYSIKLN